MTRSPRRPRLVSRSAVGDGAAAAPAADARPWAWCARAVALGALGVAAAAAAQQRAMNAAGRPAGTWDGVAGGQRITVTLDSGSTGWHGTLLAPSVQRDAIPFTSIVITRDSIALRLPGAAQNATLRGIVSTDGSRFDGIVIAGTDSSGLFRLARHGSPAAEQLLARLAVAPASSARHASQDPDSARLVTSDIALFWNVLARAAPESLETLLQREYLDRGTPGLRDFIPGRIIGAAELARQIQLNRERYEAARANTLRVTEAEPGIRAAFRSLKALYADAVFPDVYFVIGRFNSGGTASPNGLLIGAEMYHDPGGLPSLVAHELIHFQQVPHRGPGPRTLLAQSFIEGSADFVGEMISGGQINSAAQRYGRLHEHELWTEFKERMNGTNYTGWLYGDPPGERPADLGYFTGYRIAQAYYTASADKTAALRDIIRAEDVEAILSKGGYNP